VRYFLLAILLAGPLTQKGYSALCTELNYCEVSKKISRNGDWKTEFTKELRFDKFCSGGIKVPILQASPDPTSKDPIESKDHVGIDLFTTQLSNVVASGTAPLDSNGISFTQRIRGNKMYYVTVTCIKK
jgi:hypothetical protein